MLVEKNNKIPIEIEVLEGDTGLPVMLTGTAVTLLVKKPSGIVAEIPATITGENTCDTVLTNEILDAEGEYKFQINVKFPGGMELNSDIVQKYAHRKIKPLEQ